MSQELLNQLIADIRKRSDAVEIANALKKSEGQLDNLKRVSDLLFGFLPQNYQSTEQTINDLILDAKNQFINPILHGKYKFNKLTNDTLNWYTSGTTFLDSLLTDINAANNKSMYLLTKFLTEVALAVNKQYERKI